LRYNEDLGTALTRDELRHVCRVPGLQQDHFHLLGLHLLDERGKMLRRRGNPWPVLDDPPVDQPERGVEVWPAIMIADDLCPTVGREDGLPTAVGGGEALQKRLPVGLELRRQLREHLGKSGSDSAGDGWDVGWVKGVVRATERMDVAQRPVDRTGG